MKKERKIVFSPRIDRTIDGYTLGISFILIAAFILLNDSYFVHPMVSYFVGAIFGLFGVVGFGIELSKSTDMKGMEDFSVGLFLLGLWVVFYFAFSSVWVNTAVFIVLVLGIYCVIRGIVRIIYSIFFWKSSGEKKSKTTTAKDAFLFLIQVSGFCLTILNILNIFHFFD